MVRISVGFTIVARAKLAMPPAEYRSREGELIQTAMALISSSASCVVRNQVDWVDERTFIRGLRQGRSLALIFALPLRRAPLTRNYARQLEILGIFPIPRSDYHPIMLRKGTRQSLSRAVKRRCRRSRGRDTWQWVLPLARIRIVAGHRPASPDISWTDVRDIHSIRRPARRRSSPRSLSRSRFPLPLFRSAKPGSTAMSAPISWEIFFGLLVSRSCSRRSSDTFLSDRRTRFGAVG